MLHPYVYSAGDMALEVEEFRDVLTEHREGSKPLWITELGWGSEPPSAKDGFAKGPRGQAAELTAAFRQIQLHRRAWRLASVFWFAVQDAPGACNFCGGAGLFGPGFKPKPAWLGYKKFA